ncbi:hypothetical protein [Streptomyces sp. JJ38]|uniref:hypothetical protein n=1 Tax=Streptomyces sp. JJ38 TaxID=2738128 RepID=UPI001C59E235|nr:hypothetical protein [Streptomyces sp. JJ38]MBW1599682.1 hypothetical protein [Streptomyces sp. JJ38]
MADAPTRRAPGAAPPSGGIGSGPGRLLVTLYIVFTVGAASRSAYQIATRFDEAPLPYTLSAVAALVYAAITVALLRGGETARRTALAGCVAELAGVLVVGTWSVFDPGAFPDTTVWSAYGMGYLFIPLGLPVVGLWWLRRSRGA